MLQRKLKLLAMLSFRSVHFLSLSFLSVSFQSIIVSLLSYYCVEFEQYYNMLEYFTIRCVLLEYYRDIGIVFFVFFFSCRA